MEEQVMDGWLTPQRKSKYKRLLLMKLKEIMGDVSDMERGAFEGSSELSHMPVHLADLGTDNYELEFSLGLMESEKKTIREIIDALKRLEDGSFGICEGLGTPIEKPRLKAIPWTRYSMEYARMIEKGLANPSESFRRRKYDRSVIEEEDDEGGDEDLELEDLDLSSVGVDVDDEESEDAIEEDLD
ncbi:General stress protein 16O [Anaerohalosphaera lusitana]|uniref:General stress protein 16O n=1 Tax=Anaerohalosphaera lusitana TaxID=1936003 RepID=A0A1U9NKV5_9BACT|nr:TraR/DksA family transcriptional regulator [Anaerohalosphaera lusitana]AQT68146.1 General stress protein 16O [Anaerohalosphaera lusitana]